MPAINSIPLIDDWVTSHKLKGKPSKFKILLHESEGDGFYTRRVEGWRYRSFGIYQDSSGFHVTHIRSGGSCGPVFTTEKSARLFIYCITPLTDWKSIAWADKEPHLPSPLLEACLEAASYFQGEECDCETLLSLILPYLTEKDGGIINYETEIVEFGEEEYDPSKAKVVRHEELALAASVLTENLDEDDGWGTTVT